MKGVSYFEVISLEYSLKFTVLVFGLINIQA